MKRSVELPDVQAEVQLQQRLTSCIHVYNVL